MSHAQWENTVRDLLKLPESPGLASGFSKDAVASFANNGESLSVADQLRLDYQRAAETLAQQIARDPTALSKLMPGDAPADGTLRARAFITEVGRRAHRRPLEDEEVEEYLALFRQAQMIDPVADEFATGAQVVLQAMLQSPLFLYRTELGAANARLDDYEIAAKLSYALANTMPDEPLFAAAASGILATAAGLAGEARRLLAGAEGPARPFHGQLFGLDDYTEIQKDGALVPEWQPAIAASMKQESELFLAEMFASGKNFAEILTAPFAFVDATLAGLYGVPAPAGDEFARVELDPAERAGFLTRLGFLAKFAGSIDPDPIHRGAFIVERILCVELPPPTVTVFPEPPAGLATNRERIEALTGKGTCGEVCHGQWMNPAGFAFEHYDGLGRYRAEDNGQPVNAADTYPFSDGPRTYEDAIGFSRAIAESEDSHKCYARHWVTYLQGRALRPSEAPLVEALAGASKEGRPVKDLVLEVVTHDGFVTRLP